MAGCTVYELRQYTLHPGQRDVLIDVFDREFIESQEAVGLQVVGQFRDLRNPDRFVWFRGFANMHARRAGLTAFYGGPVWAAHKDVANPTMRDFDDVLLLRPVPGRNFPPALGRRPAPGAASSSESLYVTHIYPLVEPLDAAAVQQLAGQLSACVEQVDGQSICLLETENATNDYPALPVREGEHVVVHLSRYRGRDQFEALQHDSEWQEAQRLVAEDALASPVELHLAPTARSLLR